MNKSENATYQNLWDAAIAVFNGNFINVNTNIRREERSQLRNINTLLKKEEQNKPKEAEEKK